MTTGIDWKDAREERPKEGSSILALYGDNDPRHILFSIFKRDRGVGLPWEKVDFWAYVGDLPERETDPVIEAIKEVIPGDWERKVTGGGVDYVLSVNDASLKISYFDDCDPEDWHISWCVDYGAARLLEDQARRPMLTPQAAHWAAGCLKSDIASIAGIAGSIGLIDFNGDVSP